MEEALDLSFDRLLMRMMMNLEGRHFLFCCSLWKGSGFNFLRNKQGLKEILKRAILKVMTQQYDNALN